MKVEGAMITSPSTQIKFLESSNVRMQVQVAKTTESVEVMEKIVSDANPRILIALATNPNLPVKIEEELANLSGKHPGIGKALLERRE